MKYPNKMWNMHGTLPVLLLALTVATAHAGPRSSANYAIAAESNDIGGVHTTSVNYSNDASIGGVVGVSTVASPAETAKNGYIGQLYEVVGVVVSASSTSINEGTTLQLGASQLLDDSTFLTLSANAPAWSVITGPVASINTSGLATAAMVYQNTPATVSAAYNGFTGTQNLTVVNVNNDDYGSYAEDGIDDAWQVQYFGANNPKAAPNVDADGTGQTNLFKYMAGLNPIDPTSRFIVTIQPVSGQPGQKQIIFTPTATGRTYTVVSKASLIDSNWVALTGTTQSDSGQQRTVTDLSASSPRKFYQVQISKP